MFKLKRLLWGLPTRKAGLSALIAITASLLTPLPSAQAAISLEYPIDSLVDNNSLPLAPSINTLGAGSLFSNGFVSPEKITMLTQFYFIQNNLDELNTYIPGAKTGEYLEIPLNTAGNLAIDYSNATMAFGAEPDTFGSALSYFSLFLDDGNSLSHISNIQINQPFSRDAVNLSIDLSGIPTQSGAHSLILTPWVANPDLGSWIDIDSTGTLQNLTIQNAVATASPVPEPHEYALAAGLGLVGFAAYRRRSKSRQESHPLAENNI